MDTSKLYSACIATATNRNLTIATDFNGRSYALMSAYWIIYFNTLEDLAEYLEVNTDEDDTYEDDKTVISRSLAVELVNQVEVNDGFSNSKYYKYLHDHLEIMPSAKPGENTGYWIDTNDIFTNSKGQTIHTVICSECSGLAFFRKALNVYIGAARCPSCGCHMCAENPNNK